MRIPVTFTEQAMSFITGFSGTIQGPKGDKGDKGDPGTDGVSPSASVTQTASGATVTVTDATGTTTANITNGAKGDKGDTGDTGATGATGATGNGIASISKTGTVGNVDTYTVTFTDGTTTTFTVTNGNDGANGQDGEDGNGIASAVLNADYTLTLTFTDGTSYTTPSIRGATGADGQQGQPGQAGADGDDGFSPVVTTTAITGGHRVTITDATGAHTFDVMDGAGAGDMVSSTYDPAGGARQVAFADEIPTVSSDVFIATITSSGGNYSSDKTYAEIVSASHAGKVCLANMDDSIYHLCYIANNKTYFFAVDENYTESFVINSSNVVTWESWSSENPDYKVTSIDSSSTNTQYPSAKAVWNLVSGKENIGKITISGVEKTATTHTVTIVTNGVTTTMTLVGVS